MNEKDWRVRIEWYRTTHPNITTEIVVRAKDANTAIAIAALDVPRPSNVVGMCNPCAVSVTGDHDG